MSSIAKFICVFLLFVSGAHAQDQLAAIQKSAIAEGKSDVAHWGIDPENYTLWRTHSNRLIPVYTYGTLNGGEGVDLRSYTGPNSAYRSEDRLREIYGRTPEQTLCESAVWMDQTNIADIQKAAVQAGKKYIFLVVFDGMDWQTTQAAAIYNQQAIMYEAGRGSGTFFQRYKANGTTQYGFMVTSPHNNGTKTDVNAQTVENPGGARFGGYNPAAGGFAPWDVPADLGYLLGKPTSDVVSHAYTDSASSATSMTVGAKTYNNAITVGPSGEKLFTIAHEVQEAGWAVGAVSSVPISHATPACAYAHNVSRKDYQDISRDMLGLPSIAHPTTPLPGLDVVVGGGYGVTKKEDKAQGDNFQPGNYYLADADFERSSIDNGGRYVAVQCEDGKSGSSQLMRAAKKAAAGDHRLLGFYGVEIGNGHLPFQTANGDYKPVIGNGKKTETYTDNQLKQNPNLKQMTKAALVVLESRKTPFWLMVEAGDVDWANHDNNLDNSIGAVKSGDQAVKAIAEWVEANSNWDESIMIVTADHGHMLNVIKPEALIVNKPTDKSSETQPTEVKRTN